MTLDVKVPCYMCDGKLFEEKMRRPMATLTEKLSESAEIEKAIRANCRNPGPRERVSLLTPSASSAKLSSVFTPRWISRKASSGVLFLWGGERAS